MTTAEDRIADFRLKMNVGVRATRHDGDVLEARGHAGRWPQHAKRSTIVNLLPLEHEAAIDLGELARTRRVIRVQFIDGVGGTTVGHDAKAVKGSWRARC